MKRSHKIALWVGGGVIALPVMIAYGAANNAINDTKATPAATSTTAPATVAPTPSKRSDRPTGDEVLRALASQTGHGDPAKACPSISWLCHVEKVKVHTGGNVDIQYSDLDGIDTDQAAKAIHNHLSNSRLFDKVHVVRILGPDGWEVAKAGSYL